MFRFEDLRIWKLSVEYGERCYEVANQFPAHEKFSLSNQLRRAGISISNNIAEGSVGSNDHFKKHLNIAVGSALETVNIINFAYKVGYINKELRDDLYKKAESLIKQMQSFSNSLDS